MLVGLTVPAKAGDASLKDPIPDNLTWYGVTVYGAIDVNYLYQTHGAPLNGAYPPGLEYTISGSKNANRPISSFAQSGMEQSKLGLKIEEPIGDGWTAIGKIEGAFNPLSGEIADACKSMVENNGVPLAAQSANANGSRCGELFSGPAYAGISSVTYGTLMIGRQQSLETDAIAIYDPTGLTAVFALIGSAGGTAAGFGTTEPGRWDNSAKYLYQYGPVHAAAAYSTGGADTAMFGGGYGFNAGAAYRGFSIDGVYTIEKSIVSTAPIGYGILGAPGTCNAAGTGGTPCPTGNFLNGTVSDSEGWSVMGKYTYSLGEVESASPKLNFFAGYVHTQLTDPHRTVATGAPTIGGYELFYVNNQPYAAGSARVLQTVWTGARYELPSGLRFAVAYYYVNQGAYLTAATPTGTNTCAYITAANKANPAYVGNPAAGNCAADLNMGSFMVDYQFNKHLDLYSGVNYSQVAGGLGSGFLSSDMAVFVSGLRLKF